MDYANLDYLKKTRLVKYQWDECHDWDLGINWGEEEDEGELITVPEILNLIRSSNLGGNKLISLRKDNCFKWVLTNLKLGEKKLSYIHMLCSDAIDDKFPYEVILPKKSFWQELTSPEMAYINPSEICRKNLISTLDKKKYVRYDFHLLNMPNDNISKITYSKDIALIFVVPESESNIFEEYVFPTWEYLLTKNRLTPEEIKIVREGIKNVGNQTEKENLYLLLQSKVEYKNQRDNLGIIRSQDIKSGHKKTQDVSDRMCNLTSLAMAFEYLGISKNDIIGLIEKDKELDLPEVLKGESIQVEDLLDFIRDEKDYGDREAYKAWDSLANLFNLATEEKWINSSKKSKQNINIIRSHLKQGKGIVVSMFLNKGHIVRVQNIDENGITIDDPNGELNSMAKREFAGVEAKNNYDINETNLNENGKKGEDNTYTWNEIDVAVLEGRGGNVEIDENTIIGKVKFIDWIKSKNVTISDYETEEREIEVPAKNDPKKKEKKEITYYKAKGATIKCYKIYSTKKQ